MPDRTPGLVSRPLAALALAAGLVPTLRAADVPVAPALLARAGEYARRFEAKMTAMVGDEDYRQEGTRRYGPVSPSWDGPVTPSVQPSNGNSLNSIHLVQVAGRQRRTQAEMLFLWLPEETAWLTVRNVLSVDGEPVPGSEQRLDDAVGQTAVGRRTRLRRLRDDNTLFNLGSIDGSVNYPTVALQYLDPALQPRFRFTTAGHARLRGVETTMIAFVEQRMPAVGQENGAAPLSRGTLWVADADGAVLRTRMALRVPTPDTVVNVEVDYRPDAALDLWVPERMRETYQRRQESQLAENMEGVATYSNFRPFGRQASTGPLPR